MDSHLLLELLSSVPPLPSCPPPLELSSHTKVFIRFLTTSDVSGGGTQNSSIGRCASSSCTL